MIVDGSTSTDNYAIGDCVDEWIRVDLMVMLYYELQNISFAFKETNRSWQPGLALRERVSLESRISSPQSLDTEGSCSGIVISRSVFLLACVWSGVHVRVYVCVLEHH